MPIAPASLAALDENLNRLATETILAAPGKDEGLVPSYSLLGELRELCAGEPVLHAAVTAVHAALEKRLDTAQPFDAETLGALRQLVEWLPGALAAVKAGETTAPFTQTKAAPVE